MQDSIIFFINNIPPDYGGGYLRAFRMAERYFKRDKLAGIMTLSNKNSFLEKKSSMGMIEKILFLKKGFLLPISIVLKILKNKKEFNSLYIVSIHWYTFFAVVTCLLIKKKVIIGITLSKVDSPALRSKNIFLNFYYKIKNLQFKLCDKIVVNSPLVLDECIKEGYSSSKVEFIPNPVDIERFQALIDSREMEKLRDDLKLVENEKILLFIGIVNTRKGADKLVPICELLNLRELNYRMLILGNHDKSDETGEIVRKVRNYNELASNKISFLGVKENIESYLKIADVLIFPSNNEGLPNVVIEAMAAGTPIISSELTGITDYLLESDSLVDVNDLDSFALKIEKMLGDKILRSNHIDVNRAFVKSYLSIPTIDNKFDKLFGIKTA